jgi:hypothetical protein
MRRQSRTVFVLPLLLAAGTLVVAGAAYADEKEKKGKAEMAAAAKVTIEEGDQNGIGQGCEEGDRSRVGAQAS